MPKGAPRAAADVEEDCRSEGSVGVCDGSEADSPRLELSGVAAAALQQFYAEQQQQSNVDPFAADFGLSQFWYTEETSAAVAEEAVRLAGGGAIACIACPSLFRHLQRHHPTARVHLLEYDPRFEVSSCTVSDDHQYAVACTRRVARMRRCIMLLHIQAAALPRPQPRPPLQVLGHFTLYDYNSPLDVPDVLHGAFDVVVADPPYLALECLEKTAETMRLLSRQGRDGATGGSSSGGQSGVDVCRNGASLLLLTGATMRQAAQQLLGLRPWAFRPQHSHKLGNEFYLYSSVESSAKLGGWDNQAHDECDFV